MPSATKGPWPRPVALFKAKTHAEVEAWTHWVRRPCGACRHAFVEHDNNPFEGTVDCRHCSCDHFEEPVESDCGHVQAQPTEKEIAGCLEVIVRCCAECGAELWWNVIRWRRL